ncbi:pinensin family lanthipeptide [Roseivirga sp. BDSF3-8]
MKKKISLEKLNVESFTTDNKRNHKGGATQQTLCGTGLCTGCPPIQCY